MENELVRNAIHRLHLAPGNDARIAFYRQLSHGVLLVAVAESSGESAQSGTLQEETVLAILTTSIPDGGKAVLAFTDAESLRAYAPHTPYIVIDSQSVLEAVVDQEYDALILNAAGPWAGIPREDIVRILNGVWSQASK